MQNHDASTSGCRFEEANSFTENCAAFLSALEAVDKEMTAILRANWEGLVDIVREGDRDSARRGHFNSAVATALDKLATSLEREERE